MTAALILVAKGRRIDLGGAFDERPGEEAGSGGRTLLENQGIGKQRARALVGAIGIAGRVARLLGVRKWTGLSSCLPGYWLRVVSRTLSSTVSSGSNCRASFAPRKSGICWSSRTGNFWHPSS